VCNEAMLQVNSKHLSRHGLTVPEYRALYPDAGLSSGCTRTRKAAATRARTGALLRDPDDNLYSIMAGTLLGDGYLEATKSSDGRTGRYREGGNNQQYLQWKADKLGTYCPVRLAQRLSAPHARSGKRYTGWWLSTVYTPWLGELRAIWYPRGTKVVPRTWLERHMTEVSLALWFFDDGHMDKTHRGAHLSTLGFSYEDNVWLAQLVASKFRLHFDVKRASGKHLLYLGAGERAKLVTILAANACPGMEYKYAPPPVASRGRSGGIMHAAQ